MKFSKLFELVQQYHDNNAYHKKRGFRLGETNVLQCLNHLIEETVELQAEACISDDEDSYKELEEAADVLLVFLHYLIIQGINPNQVLFKRAKEKLEDVFTFNFDEVLTKRPGYTRGNRNDDEYGDLERFQVQL